MELPELSAVNNVILDPFLIFLQRKLISYILHQFCSIKKPKTMVWFLLFSLTIFVTSAVVAIYYIPDAVIETCSAKKMSLKFIAISRLNSKF